MINHAGEVARREDYRGISHNRDKFDGIVTDRPFVRRARLLRQVANPGAASYAYITLYEIHWPPRRTPSVKLNNFKYD